MYVAHDADPARARQQIAACNDRFLSGLGVQEKVPHDPIRHHDHDRHMTTTASTARTTTTTTTTYRPPQPPRR